MGSYFVFKTKRTFQHIANINLSIDRLQANLEGLKEFNGLTHDEIISEIKALTNVKLAEKIEHFEVAKTEEEQKILMNKLEFILADSPDFADFLEWKKEKIKMLLMKHMQDMYLKTCARKTFSPYCGDRTIFLLHKDEA